MQNIWKTFKKPIKILAPMEDVTDTVFRQIINQCGRPDLFFTEFTSVDGIFSEGRAQVIKRLKFEEFEKPIIAQIWGTTPEKYYKAGKYLADLGFDGIDINMGCPVGKVVKNGCCSALIAPENRELAREIIEATIEGSSGLPVSVKTRLGFREIQTEEWTEFLLGFDIAALTMHGRIAKHLSKYPADWNEIGKVVKLRDKINPKILIIGNGDVNSLTEIDEKVKKYGVDGVMVGRGIFQDTFLFGGDKHLNDLELKERLALLLKHAKLFVETWGQGRNFNVLKKFFKIYCSDFPGAQDLRTKLMECEDLKEVENIVKEWKF